MRARRRCPTRRWVDRAGHDDRIREKEDGWLSATPPLQSNVDSCRDRPAAPFRRSRRGTRPGLDSRSGGPRVGCSLRQRIHAPAGGRRGAIGIDAGSGARTNRAHRCERSLQLRSDPDGHVPCRLLSRRAGLARYRTAAAAGGSAVGGRRARAAGGSVGRHAAGAPLWRHRSARLDGRIPRVRAVGPRA